MIRRVSIPHRYSSSTSASARQDPAPVVSIPHRYSSSYSSIPDQERLQLVSIPHRYSSSKSLPSVISSRKAVSIPHRYSSSRPRARRGSRAARFQSLIGTLAATGAAQEGVAKMARFQSLIGTLAAISPASAPTPPSRVSIPHRYSSSLRDAYTSIMGRHRVSIPHRYSSSLLQTTMGGQVVFVFQSLIGTLAALLP